MRHAETSEYLLENASVITQARLLASSSMLAALPVSTFENLLDDASLCISVGLRLDYRICMEHNVEVWWISGVITDFPVKRAEEDMVAIAR